MSPTQAGTTCLAPPGNGVRERRRVAVVGGGASATAFLCALTKRVSAELIEAPDVVLCEPASPCGPGVAYRDDTEIALLNRPVSAMSADYVDRGHFRRWLGKNELTNVATDPSSTLFVPRSYFGRYLTEVFDTALNDLRNLGSSVEILREPVHDVQPTAAGRSAVMPAGSATFWADEVVLCLGSVPARDIYQLAGAPGYIHQPYPVRATADAAEEGANVLVLGSGLTAVDVALAMGHRTDSVRVTLASRTGLVPDVRCDLGADNCAPHLLEDVRAALAQRATLDLSDLAQLLEGELTRAGTTLREALRPFLTKADGAQLLRTRLSDPDPAAAVQRCIVALTPWYSRLWRALDSTSSAEFTRRFGRIFTSLRSPMPPVNAQRLLELTADGTLSFEAGLRAVRPEGSGFRAWFRHSGSRLFDAVVNATGRGIDLDFARPGTLVDTLLRNGFARPHPLGGLDVDPDSNEVLDTCGASIPRLHVIGDLSSGVHFHTSSMEYVATQAGRVAESVTARLPSYTGVLP